MVQNPKPLSNLFFRCLPVGILQANCYLIGNAKSKVAAIVDPGGEPELIINVVKKHQLRVKYIFNSHGHFDHIAANRAVKEVTGAPILIHPADAEWLIHPLKQPIGLEFIEIDSPPADEYLHDGDCYNIDELEIKIIHTPGHSPGGVCIILNDRILTGDTLFCGSIGRTDLPGGSDQEMETSLQHKIITLPDTYLVYPGHGSATTIGDEKQSNPYL